MLIEKLQNRLDLNFCPSEETKDRIADLIHKHARA